MSIVLLHSAAAATSVLSVPDSKILLDRPGQVREKTGEYEVRDRQYEAHGAFPVTMNGISLVADEIKVISNLRIKGGVGEQQGTIDVDVDTVPGGHLTLQYRGSATKNGSLITSSGQFKVEKASDTLGSLLKAQGTYSMTVDEMSGVEGSPVTMNISATSR